MRNLENKKIAFFGTPNFTVEFLELFKQLNLEISVIVTGEDKPFGRGMQMKSSGPKKWGGGSTNPIKIFQPEKLDDDFYNILVAENNTKEFDLFIVIAYGKIIPEKIINMPKHGTINLHYSLLPKYRGASPVESAILNGDIETGITIQQMVYKLDAGDILLQEKMTIGNDDTTSMLLDRLNKKALEIFPGFLNTFLDGVPIEPNTQNESKATKCGKFGKSGFNVTNDIAELKNSPEKNLENIYRKYKAFDKRIYFFHKFDGKSMRVKITQVCKTPGGLHIRKVLPESKKEITLEEFERSFGEIF